VRRIGLVWADTRGLRIQRIEGTPTKKPCCWLKTLRITPQYTDLHGLWLPTYTRAAATVRAGGSYSFNGEAVAWQLSSSTVTNGASESHPKSVSATARGTLDAHTI
jgi:hypothetical protein